MYADIVLDNGCPADDLLMTLHGHLDMTLCSCYLQLCLVIELLWLVPILSTSHFSLNPPHVSQQMELGHSRRGCAGRWKTSCPWPPHGRA